MPGREPNREDAPYRPWGPGHPEYPKPTPNPPKAKAKKKKQFRNDPHTSANA